MPSLVRCAWTDEASWIWGETIPRHVTKSSCLRFNCPDNYDLDEWEHSQTPVILKSLVCPIQTMKKERKKEKHFRGPFRRFWRCHIFWSTVNNKIVKQCVCTTVLWLPQAVICNCCAGSFKFNKWLEDVIYLRHNRKNETGYAGNNH